MLDAAYAVGKLGQVDAEGALQLTFPVSFAVGDGARLAPREETRLSPTLSDAQREMMAWSPWMGAAPAAPPRSQDDQYQMRVDLTVDDAEELVEALPSLIALAKDSMAKAASRPAALAYAGTKIGPAERAAPPRFTSAQLEMLSRKKRRLSLEPDGRVVHPLQALARVERRLRS